MKKILNYSVVVFVFSLGCVSLKPLPPVKPELAREIWGRFWSHQEKLRLETQKIEAKVNLDFSDKNRSVSGKGSILAGPEGMRLELRDVLGRLQYEVGFQLDRQFIAYYPTQSVAYLDRTNGTQYLRQFLKLEMSFNELKDLWLGVLPLKQKEVQLTGMSHAEDVGKYLAYFKKGDLRLEGQLDGVTLALSHLRWQTPKLKAEFEYSNFTPCCRGYMTDESLPYLGRDVFLKTEDENIEIELQWSDIKGTKNKTKENFQLELPAKVRKIDLLPN